MLEKTAIEMLCLGDNGARELTEKHGNLNQLASSFPPVFKVSSDSD